MSENLLLQHKQESDAVSGIQEGDEGEPDICCKPQHGGLHGTRTIAAR